MPQFYTGELEHFAAKGSNLTAKIPAIYHKTHQVNISFVIVKKVHGKEVKVPHKVQRISEFLIEVLFHVTQVREEDYGVYEAVMLLTPHQKNMKRRVCLYMLKDPSKVARINTNVAVIVGCLVGVVLVVAIFIASTCYFQHNKFPFRRMSRSDEQSLHLHEMDSNMNDDVFLPDVAHASGTSHCMVPMATLSGGSSGVKYHNNRDDDEIAPDADDLNLES